MRILDIFFSLLSLFLLSPILICCSIILKFTGEKKVFYYQKRIGKNGKNFRIIKFATMLERSPFTADKTLTITDDPRVLPFGKFLRLSKLNELPQLMNVLRGEMSLVGPRPLVRRDLAAVEEKLKFELLSVPPGITSIGSIFFRNEEKYLQPDIDVRKFYDTVISPYKVKLDLYYIRNKNVKLYFA